MPTAVVAIGGNSLITDPEHQSVEDQYLAAAETDHHIANMVASGWNVVVTHGNGPQIGFILRRSEMARHELHEVPLEVCGADTQGAIGYLLQQNLLNDFKRMGLPERVVTLVTQVEVSADDPAFQHPAKPIGTFMTETEALERRTVDGWDVMEDSGRGWRRVVASPHPLRVVELDAVDRLLKAGYVVIAAGGGGIPVVADGQGCLVGVPAVIDKDHVSALLATELHADLLLISTSVDQVALNFGQPDQRWVDLLSSADARRYLAEGTHFRPGSMEPKVRAILAFLDAGGSEAIVTSPSAIEEAIAGRAGTRFVP